jgi:hypothetical protein
VFVFPARSRRICLATLQASLVCLVAGGALAAEPSPPAAASPAEPAAETARPKVASLPPVENDAPVELPDSSAPANHIIAGAATTAVWYGIAVGHSYLWSDNPGAEELRLPIVGPWLSLGETGCPKDDPDCSTVLVVVQAVLTTLSGVGQVGGLAIIGEGLFVPTRSESKSQSSKPTELRASVQPFTPGRDGVGLGLVGTF